MVSIHHNPLGLHTVAVHMCYGCHMLATGTILWALQPDTCQYGYGMVLCHIGWNTMAINGQCLIWLPSADNSQTWSPPPCPSFLSSFSTLTFPLMTIPSHTDNSTNISHKHHIIHDANTILSSGHFHNWPFWPPSHSFNPTQQQIPWLQICHFTHVLHVQQMSPRAQGLQNMQGKCVKATLTPTEASL